MSLALLLFLFRLSFGLAAAMAMTSPRKVTSGYYRNHLYVLLGLGALASAVSIGSATQIDIWPGIALAVLSYVGAVAWLYEKAAAGRVVLVLVAAAALCGAWLARPLAVFDHVAGGLVLGTTLAAMFLGHWYLNTPTMSLDPLRRLILLMAAVLVIRMVLAGGGLAFYVAEQGVPGGVTLAMLGLRWLSGLVGALVVAAMAWQTLKIPNTQSATGILYVGVVLTFVGELCSQLLSAESPFPL